MPSRVAKRRHAFICQQMNVIRRIMTSVEASNGISYGTRHISRQGAPSSSSEAPSETGRPPRHGTREDLRPSPFTSYRPHWESTETTVRAAPHTEARQPFIRRLKPSSSQLSTGVSDAPAAIARSIAARRRRTSSPCRNASRRCSSASGSSSGS